MKGKIREKMPVALVCGMLLDANRALFLAKKDEKGNETIELPCVPIYAGENPAAAAVGALKEQAGIDAQAHEIIMRGKHNVGSRKRKEIVPVLVFRMGAKNVPAKVSSAFCGYRWLEEKQAATRKFSRKCEWLIGMLKK